jgi:hypothetical protein
MNQTCRGCGGKRLLHSDRVVARGLLGGPIVLTNLAQTRMSARVCVDCGHIDFRATDLATLRTTYAEHEVLDLESPRQQTQPVAS